MGRETNRAISHDREIEAEIRVYENSPANSWRSDSGASHHETLHTWIHGDGSTPCSPS